jgi:4-amino-4-deoxy-L-arabinose transferase-like glycosyltransferase
MERLDPPAVAETQAAAAPCFVVRETGSLHLIPVLIVLWAVVYGLDLWGRDVWTENEARYALGAQSVLRGDWVVPRIAGPILADKPPLFFWYVAVVSAPFGGVNEATTRFANLLVALLVFTAIHRFGGAQRNRWAGLLAAAITATMFEFWRQTTRPGVDILFTAMLTIGWLAMYLILAREFTWRRWAGLWGCLGLAFLTKGPLTLVLSGLAAVLFALWQFGPREGWRRLWSLRPIRGVAAAIAPFLLWALLVLAVKGFDPLWSTVVRHNFGRFVQAFDHQQPWYFYLIEFPLSTLPWSLLLPFAIWQLARTWRGLSDSERHPLAFSLVVIVGSVAFLSLSSSKREYYLLPTFPWLAYLLAATALRSIGAAAAGAQPPPDCSEREFIGHLKSARLGQAILAVFILMTAAMTVVTAAVNPFLGERKSFRAVAEAVNESEASNEPLVVVNDDTLRILFYVERPFEYIDNTPAGLAALRALLARHPRLDLFIEKSNIKFLQELKGTALFIERALEHGGKKYYVLTTAPAAGLKRLEFK